MGFAIAAAAAARGHEVTVVSGPVALPTPKGVTVVPVTSARDMLDAARAALGTRADDPECDVLIGVAAVCDYRPKERTHGKPAKTKGGYTLELVENPDVIATLAGLGRARLAVGFALEELARDPHGAFARARAKLARKQLDAIVLNDLSVMEGRAQRLLWIPRDGEESELQGADKAALGEALVVTIEQELSESSD